MDLKLQTLELYSLSGNTLFTNGIPIMALGHHVTGVEGEESMQARIERLGRQRPAEFKSIWTEIGFCFSLLASMVMAVSVPFPCLCQTSPLTSMVGVFHQWFQRHSTHPGNRPRHPCRVANVAGEYILSDHRGFLTSFWPPRWHLRWLRRLHVRVDLVLPLVLDRRF